MEGLSLISGGSVMFIVRLIVGGVMIYYGWPKVRDLKKNAKDFDRKFGFRPGWLWGDIVAFTEFAGGIAMIAGIWPGFVAAAFGFEMLTGAFVYMTFPYVTLTRWDTLIAAVILAFVGAALSHPQAPRRRKKK